MATALCAGLLGTTTPVVAHADDPVNVIRGIVVLPDGTPAPNVPVSLWTLARAASEAESDVRPFASLLTDANGGFDYSIDRDAAKFLTEALDNNGAFNYLVVAHVTVPPGAGNTVNGVVSSGTEYLLNEVGYLTLVGADLTNVLDKSGVSPSFQAPPTDTTYVLSQADGAGTENVGTSNCSYYVRHTTVLGHQVAMEPIGEVHAYYDATAKFTYGATANTDIGVGFKYGTGPWQVTAGGAHQGQSGSEVSITIGHHTGRVVRSQFGFRKEKIEWFNGGGGAGEVPCATWYQIVPEGWMRGGIDLSRDVSAGDSGGQFDAARAKGNYSRYGPRGTWRKYQGKGFKYTYDAVAYGVTLHATSGWGTNVEINWTFGTGDLEHDLYNVNAHPSDAKIVYSY